LFICRTRFVDGPPQPVVGGSREGRSGRLETELEKLLEQLHLSLYLTLSPYCSDSAQAVLMAALNQRMEEQGGKVWEMETELENFLLENTGTQERAKATDFFVFSKGTEQKKFFKK
jgi:hypothetical protein